jgi:hypothetical protein
MIFKCTKLFCIVFMLAGCATSKEIYLPDGTKGYNISCDGTMQSMNACYQKAGELCGSNGYELLNREGEMIPISLSTGTANVDASGAGNAGYVTQSGMAVFRSLFVRCGKSMP